MLLGTIFAVLAYFATAVFVVGLLYRIVVYARTPAPLKIPTTPAPVKPSGVVIRMAKEVVFFESLFKANKWTWLFGWVFHAALLLVVMRHLRYFTEPVWSWVKWVQPFGLYASFAMLAGLVALWLRRFVVERIRYISGPSDHLMLLLLIGIAATGLLMKYVVRTDIVALKAFVLGLIYFDWQPIPNDAVLLIHLGLVLALMIVFPFSKLLHAPGVFFSPGRNQADNPREKRHLAPWAAALDAGRQKAGGK
ncbi:MAG: respiratory nitrate reductase subunit gamma [Gammaproteobacteria bacterium]|nr:respiratory nitrate reductase subunit gamma [Gammaproteobacteria bacterium]MDH3362794.1 respiratory nitrate reductase subunit gamma [Gammaproteobacteria bacterium]MDH3481362.1 respiratory nitrate reductase subunit gamma [Gammaproteobacteria bacterium]